MRHLLLLQPCVIEQQSDSSVLQAGVATFGDAIHCSSFILKFKEAVVAVYAEMTNI